MELSDTDLDSYLMPYFKEQPYSTFEKVLRNPYRLKNLVSHSNLNLRPSSRASLVIMIIMGLLRRNRA